jgi:serine/threonine protein kinase
VLNKKPYGKSVDWWSFGIFIYESNRGKPPFSASGTGSGSNLNSLFDSIRKGLFKIPKQFSLNLADICKRLIEVNVSKRLGCLKGESDDVKRHRWLNEIEWMKLFKQTIPSPYVPKSIEPLDIAFKNSTNKDPEEPLQISKLNKYKNEFFEF